MSDSSFSFSHYRSTIGYGCRLCKAIIVDQITYVNIICSGACFHLQDFTIHYIHLQDFVRIIFQAFRKSLSASHTSY
jgi:hypothetical protein